MSKFLPSYSEIVQPEKRKNGFFTFIRKILSRWFVA